MSWASERMTPRARSASISATSTDGSSTTPLPMTQVFPAWRMPLGMRVRIVFSPPTTRVCPALFPPWNRTTTWACWVSRSTTLPFPSSPHWAPTTTTFGMVGPGPIARAPAGDNGRRIRSRAPRRPDDRRAAASVWTQGQRGLESASQRRQLHGRLGNPAELRLVPVEREHRGADLAILAHPPMERLEHHRRRPARLAARSRHEQDGGVPAVSGEEQVERALHRAGAQLHPERHRGRPDEPVGERPERRPEAAEGRDQPERLGLGDASAPPSRRRRRARSRAIRRPMRRGEAPRGDGAHRRAAHPGASGRAASPTAPAPGSRWPSRNRSWKRRVHPSSGTSASTGTSATPGRTRAGSSRRSAERVRAGSTSGGVAAGAGGSGGNAASSTRRTRGRTSGVSSTGSTQAHHARGPPLPGMPERTR